MTNAEAIKIIDCYDIGFYDLSGEKIPADKLVEAFDMAIEALERTSNAHPTHECVEPTHECVSRQAAADFSEWNPEIISLETKTIKYYDEDEKVWKIGEVIIKQDALDILDDFQKDIENGVDSYGEHRDRLMNLPDINVGKSEDNNSYIQELRKNVESLCGNCDRPGKEELGWLILSAMEKGYELGLGSQCNVDGIAVEPVGKSDTLDEDMISRCELFNRLAVIPAPPEANEYKAEVYKVINEM